MNRLQAERGMKRGVLRVALAMAVTCAASAGFAAPASAVSCPATTTAELNTALGDSNCNPINLSATTFSGVNSAIGRTVTLQGAGAGQTVLQGNLTNTVLGIASVDPITVTINDLALTGGGGGAIDIQNGPPANVVNLNRSAVSFNNASLGSHGGGISVGTGTQFNATDVTLAQNNANANPGGGGGAIQNGGTVNLTNSLLDQNYSATGGGGIKNHVSGAIANLTNVTVSGNRADGGGGGFVGGGDTFAVLRNVTFDGNVADDDMDDGPQEDGGAVYTFGTVRVQNAILGSNIDRSGEAPDCAESVSGDLTRLGFVLVRSITGCTFSGMDDTATGFQTAVNPMLGSLTLDGGMTQTLPLLMGSPALDKIPAGSCVTSTDQRGLPRPSPAGGLCDLGAYEFQIAPPVTLTAPPTATTPAAPPAKKKKCKKRKKAGAAKKCKKKR